jgi:hypothetical protein
MSGAGIVDQQVDAPQVGEDGADARVDRLIAGDIEGREPNVANKIRVR